jgi:hypothetical protein
MLIVTFYSMLCSMLLILVSCFIYCYAKCRSAEFHGPSYYIITISLLRSCKNYNKLSFTWLGLGVPTSLSPMSSHRYLHWKKDILKRHFFYFKKKIHLNIRHFLHPVILKFIILVGSSCSHKYKALHNFKIIVKIL